MRTDEDAGVDIHWQYELKKYEGRAPRTDAPARLAKRLGYPEKQPYLIIRGGDEIPQTAEETGWKPSKARLAAESVNNLPERIWGYILAAYRRWRDRTRQNGD